MKLRFSDYETLKSNKTVKYHDQSFENYIELDNSTEYTLYPPKNFNDLTESERVRGGFSADKTTIKLPNTSLICHENAFATENGNVATADGQIPKTQRSGHRVTGIEFQQGKGWVINDDVQIVDFDEPIFIPQKHPVGNYYHTLIEHLPALYAWSRSSHQHLATVRLIDGRLRRIKLIREAAAYFFDGEMVPITGLKPGGLFRAPRIYRATYREQTDGKHEFITAQTLGMFEHLRSSIKSDKIFPKRIIISREDTPKRSLTNERDLVEALSKFGFEPVILTGMPFADQVAMFAGCEAVVGAHGAGFANIGFCPPGALVVETMRPFTLSRAQIFWELACASQLNYCIVCSDDDGVEDHAASFEANIERVTNTVEKYL